MKIRELMEWTIDPRYGYGLRLIPSGRLAPSTRGTPWWASSKERAEHAKLHSYGGDAEVVKVRLNSDQYAYNGYMAYELIDDL